jgi:hypothetical protein
MSRILQEKFEVRYPEKDWNYGNLWMSDKSARVKKGLPGHERTGRECVRHLGDEVFYNSLPPGMDIEDQEVFDNHPMLIVTSGQSDVSRDMNPEAAANGFTRRQMRPTDDMYTREHNDAFYDEITVDGMTGFLERNNMLDRE